MPIDLTAALAIDGWMRAAELRWLAEQAQSCGTIVEVGSWKGRSTRALADHCPGTVYVVDDWCLPPEAQDQTNHELLTRGPGAIIAEWRANLRDHLKAKRIVLIRGRSAATAKKVAKRIPDGGADLIFIDASHAEDAVTADILAYLPLVRPGGLLAGHDYGERAHPGVKAAVDAIFGARVQVGPHSIWSVRV